MLTFFLFTSRFIYVSLFPFINYESTKWHSFRMFVILLTILVINFINNPMKRTMKLTESITRGANHTNNIFFVQISHSIESQKATLD